MAKKMDCQGEAVPQTPKVEAPQTKAYLLKKLNELEKSTNELRHKEDELARKINSLEEERKYLCSLLAPQLEERSHLVKLYQELGGNEWEVTG